MYKVVQVPIPKYYEQNDPKAVVFHVDLGSYQGTLNHLKNVTSGSYHLYIRRDRDEIVQFVQFENGAWHAGKKWNPSEYAEKLFGGNDVNKMSISICYGGKPINAKGKVCYDWSKVVDGQKATDRQVAMAAWAVKEFGYSELDFFAHKEITDYKPKCAVDFKTRVIDKMFETNNPVCSLGQFTTKEVISELVSRFTRK